MWGKDSEVATVKERQGTRVENRKDLVEQIRKCCGYSAVTKGIVSMAINLLPYFKPDRAMMTAVFPNMKTKVKEYFDVVRNNKALQGMAWYLSKADFVKKEETGEDLTRMARAFVNSDEFELQVDEGMAAILLSIREYKPTYNEYKADGKKLVTMFERQLLCGFARELSVKFEV